MVVWVPGCEGVPPPHPPRPPGGGGGVGREEAALAIKKQSWAVSQPYEQSFEDKSPSLKYLTCPFRLHRFLLT